MNNEKLMLKYPIIVEGKYDKIKLSSSVASPIITTDGFSVFNNDEKKKLLKKLSDDNGIIILTDSDKAGFFIRSKLKSYISGNIINIYIPQIKGKEKRKTAPGKDGLLGVEGIDTEYLKKILHEYITGSESTADKIKINKKNFYEDGLSGKANSSYLRNKLSEALDLPLNMTANALLEAINLLIDYNKYKEIIQETEFKI
ncbi:MAG: hypothetical protein A2Y17_12405 [Clostridiales bacterium GWF2_38_85]|nr:MAG: hypothetical protein A2Y17_12405 [Clostridiales bacterium GWF2_38_85]HBL84059.1 DUF4093 domain-containing protein [Clostridiales bacterium]